MSMRFVSQVLAAAAAGLFLCASAKADVAMTGPLPNGYWTDLLHLGANFQTDMFTSNGPNLDTDLLSGYGGEANQEPSDGLVYAGLSSVKSTSQEPSGQLTWTAMHDSDGIWQPSNVDNYIKYWHTYLIVPGATARGAKIYTRQDDDLRIWINGAVAVNSPGYSDNEKGPFDITLQPGMNSVTIKLVEGGGGDYMAVRMTDTNGQYFDDITYALFPAKLTLVNPVTGSEGYISGDSVKISRFPSVADAVSYQFTLSDDPSSVSGAAWKPYVNGMIPEDEVSITPPAASGDEVTVYAWFLHSDGTLSCDSDSIVWTSAAPTAKAKASLSIPINVTAGTVIAPELVDDGSESGDIGIYSVSVSPDRIYGDTDVTLTVMNNAGVIATDTVRVSLSSKLDIHVSNSGDDTTGDGTVGNPYATIQKAVSVVADGGAIYLASGTYFDGESYPYAVSGISICKEPGDAGTAILDGGNASGNLFTVSSGSLALVDLVMMGTTDELVFATQSALAVTNCVFTQTQQNRVGYKTGAIELNTHSSLDAFGSTFRDMTVTAVIRLSGSNSEGSVVTLRNCLFENNAVGCDLGSNNHEGSLIYTRVNGGSAFNFYDTVFRNNSTYDWGVHDAYMSPIVYSDFTPLDIDRCQFIGNSGGNLIGICYANGDVRNSLFVENRTPYSIAHGYSSTVSFRNCTFVRGTGGFTGYRAHSELYNCILYGLDHLNHRDPHGASADYLTLHDSFIYGIDMASSAELGYFIGGSSNVTIGTDPLLANVDVLPSDAGFDARPLPYSPVIDAGDNSAIRASATDLAGSPRVANNSDASSATVDLGCYESLFHAAIQPTFQFPVPGSLSGYRGVTYQVPVTISPAVSGSVSAQISYGEGVTGPATLEFPNGAGPVTLELELLSGDATSARVTITESGISQGVLPGRFDVFMDDIVITVGGVTNIYVREGTSFDIPVSLALEGAVAPGDVAFAIDSVSGSGTSQASWIGGEAVVPAGAHSSTGSIHIEAGSGINEIVLTSGATFAETGTGTVALRVIAYPGFLVVDPENGDDDASGTIGNPMRTIDRALSVLSAGDEIHLLPGTYNASNVAFPIEPGTIALVGCDSTGALAEDSSLCVIDGANAVKNLVKYVGVSGSSTGRIANVWLRNSMEEAVYCEDSDVVVSNDFFTQSAPKGENGGALRVHNISHVEADDCCFSGMVRRAVVNCTAVDSSAAKSFTARRSVFIDNTNYQASIGANDGGPFTITVEDSDFIRNCGNANTGVHDAYASAVAYVNNDHLIMDRCRFFGNTGNHIIGQEYMGNYTCRISNSLFVENNNNKSAFHGYSGHIEIHNCTFLRNSGGYAGRIITTAIYNGIFVDDGALSKADTGDGDESSRIQLHDCIVHNITGGQRFNAAASTGVVDVEPKLANAGVAWDAEGFDARPLPYSPAIDAGDNAFVQGEYDLAGNPRIADNTDSGSAVVDFGCYESLFHAEVEPTFRVPLQGSIAGYRGVTYSIPISIAPAVSGPVEAVVTYGPGLAGPETLSFEDGADTVILALEVLDSDATFAQVVISESGTEHGILDGVYDIFMDDLVVSVEGKLNFFVRGGAEIDIPFSLALDGAVAPGDVAFTVSAIQGDGTSTAEWVGGEPLIPSGYHSSTGAIHVVGGSGLNTVRVTTSASAFAETDQPIADIGIVAHPGYLYVDPVNGSNANIGSLEQPLATIGFALSVLNAGDEVRLLPGTYSAAAEAFPYQPGMIRIVGCDATGAPAEDPSLCVIDGGNAVASLFRYELVSGDMAGHIANVWLRESISQAIYCIDSDLVVSNAFFTQGVGNLDECGGIRAHNVCNTEMIDCCFSGMVRRAAVQCSSDGGTGPLVVRNCQFIDNTLGYASVAYYDGGNRGFSATLVDCDFIRNVGQPGRGLPDCSACAAAYVNDNALYIDRCRFLGNGGNQVIGGRNTPCSIANSLFAGNNTTDSNFKGWNTRPPVVNCTFVGNSGGYDGYGFSPYFRNCVFYKDGAISKDSNDSGHSYIRDSLVFGDPVEGDLGYVEEAVGTVVTGVDPLLKNADVAWDAEGFDAHLKNNSPAIDAGNVDLVSGDLDLDGTARLKYGHTKKFGLKVDFGCYEATVPAAGTLIFLK